MNKKLSDYLRMSVEAVDSAWMKPIASAADQASLGRLEAAISAWQRDRTKATRQGLSRDDIVNFCQATNKPDELRNLVMLALAKPTQPQMEGA
jgi:hypothetical protein